MTSAPERYYLDTTAHLERWAGEPAVRAELSRLLSDRQHATSTHVNREWKRIVDGGCATILNTLRDAGGDLQILSARLRSGFGRTPAQSALVLDLVTKGQPVDTTVDIRARQFLRVLSRKMFETQIDEVRDSSECGLARNEVFRDRTGKHVLVDRCKKTDAICRQDQFLEERRPDADKAAAALAGAARRPADKNMGKLMASMIAKPPDRKGKNCYAHTGDISIALECSSDEVLLTSDQSFDTICPALRRRHHRFASTRPPSTASASTP